MGPTNAYALVQSTFWFQSSEGPTFVSHATCQKLQFNAAIFPFFYLFIFIFFYCGSHSHSLPIPKLFVNCLANLMASRCRVVKPLEQTLLGEGLPIMTVVELFESSKDGFFFFSKQVYFSKISKIYIYFKKIY